MPTLRPQHARGTATIASDLTRAVAHVNSEQAALGSGIELHLVDQRLGSAAGLVCTQDERHHAVVLGAPGHGALIQSASDPQAAAQAIGLWLQGRPVTDSEAAAHGHSVLAWSPHAFDLDLIGGTRPSLPSSGAAITASTPGQSLGWAVAVPRGRKALLWRPSADLSLRSVTTIQQQADRRAEALPLRMGQHPDIVLVTSTPASLSSALLRHPGRLRARLADAGVPVEHARAIVTPGRVLAVAADTAAARLVSDGAEAHVVLDQSDWDRLAWLP